MKDRILIRISLIFMLVLILPAYVEATTFDTAIINNHESIYIQLLVDSPAIPLFELADKKPEPGPPSRQNELKQDQIGIFNNIMQWNYWSIGMLGANTLSALIALLVDPFTGTILGILTLGGWSITTGFMAYGYRDLSISFATYNTKGIDVTVPFFASIGAASCSLGAITALGFVFDDDTGVAGPMAGVLTLISGISGIVAIVSTFGISEKIDKPPNPRVSSHQYYN